MRECLPRNTIAAQERRCLLRQLAIDQQFGWVGPSDQFIQPLCQPLLCVPVDKTAHGAYGYGSTGTDAVKTPAGTGTGR